MLRDETSQVKMRLVFLSSSLIFDSFTSRSPWQGSVHMCKLQSRNFLFRLLGLQSGYYLDAYLKPEKKSLNNVKPGLLCHQQFSVNYGINCKSKFSKRHVNALIFIGSETHCVKQVHDSFCKLCLLH